MQNIPEIKVGVVAVSRDCFPESLSVSRRKALVAAYKKKYGAGDVYECPVCIVESELHMRQALADIQKAGCNALAVYLGNFGPEISETMLAKEFAAATGGAVMFFAAAGRRVRFGAKSWQMWRGFPSKSRKRSRDRRSARRCWRWSAAANFPPCARQRKRSCA